VEAIEGAVEIGDVQLPPLVLPEGRYQEIGALPVLESNREGDSTDRDDRAH
jgi:hypothetical protein